MPEAQRPATGTQAWREAPVDTLTCRWCDAPIGYHTTHDGGAWAPFDIAPDGTTACRDHYPPQRKAMT